MFVVALVWLFLTSDSATLGSGLRVPPWVGRPGASVSGRLADSGVFSGGSLLGRPPSAPTFPTFSDPLLLSPTFPTFLRQLLLNNLTKLRKN